MKYAKKKFFILCLGQFVSAIGSGISAFALSTYVFEHSGEAGATGLVMLCAFLPNLLLTPLAGVLADRYDRRLLMLLGDGLSALGLLYILVCMAMGQGTLLHICIGVGISSVFTSLLEPAYKATISDLLPPESYSKASGLMQLAGAAKYLLAPMLAGFLLRFFALPVLLYIDIATIILTLFATMMVRKGLEKAEPLESAGLYEDFLLGWRALSRKPALLLLVALASCITFCLGVVQTLNLPMLLRFTSKDIAGLILSASAAGMIVGSLVLSLQKIKRVHRSLFLSLGMAGFAMLGFALWENACLIAAFGFVFFAMLPFANACLDFLVRCHVDNAEQGRVWGLIGLLSQLGYVFAYALAGSLVDVVLSPWLEGQTWLAQFINALLGGARGAALGIALIGLMLVLIAAFLSQNSAVKRLEKETGESSIILR